MELTQLKNRIINSFSGSESDLNAVLEMVENDFSIFPFNEYEHMICNFLASGQLKYDQYIDIRTEYISTNPNLWIFEISAPRRFGEGFAHTYVESKCSKLKRPNKRSDPNYSGEYDFFMDDIKIEVKASRAVDSDSEEPLYMKALSRETDKNFFMNFQQIKPDCCDVVVCVAVYRDQIVLWVMNSKEVKENKSFTKGQHRGNYGFEGQLHIRQDNITQFDEYELKDNSLEDAIKAASNRLS